MHTPSLGWQSWSPPTPSWHRFPRWDYSPFKLRRFKPSIQDTPKRQIRYWCSWYAYGWNISNQKIHDTLNIIKKYRLPFTHILIDDGWTAWGDWHNPNPLRFDNMADTVKQIHSHKLLAGLWFAPFLANKNSQLFKSHPEYFVKYQNHYVQGLKTLPIWESILPQQYLLNLALPQVKKYLTSFIDLAVTKWGFNLLKLDFLYAPYFDPNHNNDIIPHHQVAWILKYIKTKHPNTTIIACGAPFAPTLKLSHAIRISKDTAIPLIFPKFINRLIYLNRVKMLSLKIAINNLIAHKQIDPDVRLFTLDSPTTDKIWDTISTNILGVGDNLSNLPPKNLERIRSWLASHNSQ